MAGLWFSPVSSNNKIDCHDNTEILLKVALNTINLTLLYSGFHLSVIKRYTIKHSQQNRTNHIGDVLVTMFISDVVDCGFDPRQTKDYKIGICCFSIKQVALWSTSKDWLAQNVSMLSN